MSDYTDKLVQKVRMYRQNSDRLAKVVARIEWWECAIDRGDKVDPAVMIKSIKKVL